MGEMKVYTIRDIARIAGVSVTTVSRVLNHRPDVNEATRERVEQIMAEYHFVGNRYARNLKQASEVIGLIVRGRSNPFLNALAEAILSRAGTLPCRVVTEYIDELDDEFQTALHLTRLARVSGLIFVGSKIDERAAVLQDEDLPMVFTTVNARAASFPRAASVAIDDRAMGRVVGEEFLKCGHRRIAVLGANPVAGDSLSLRFQGFCDAFADQGLVFDRTLHRETRFSLQAGYDLTMNLLRERPDITGIFAMSDAVALGAIRAVRDLNFSVPEDISVVGFDGVEWGRFTFPRLTTVEQPVDEIAGQSVRLLENLLEGKGTSRHILVEAAFRKRETLDQVRENG